MQSLSFVFVSRVNNGYLFPKNDLCLVVNKSKQTAVSLQTLSKCPEWQKSLIQLFHFQENAFFDFAKKNYSSVSYYYYTTTTTSFYTILLVFIAFLQGSLIWLKMSADLSKTQNLFIYYIIYTTITKLLWLALYKVRNTKLDIFLYIYYIISF